MSEHSQRNFSLTRRHWLALAAAAVSGCGGGSADTTAALPGTGGTGIIYAQGSISGFGSVIVNGIRFDDTAAIVQIDGMPQQAADLRLGMVAGVQGERGVDPTLGTATHIAVWSIAQGLVTGVLHGAVTEFSIAGMAVQADASTVFDGLANAGVLATGQRVAVWGLQAGADGTQWRATRVTLVSDAALVSTGSVVVTGSQRSINGLLLMGSVAGNLTNGQLVRARGMFSVAGNSVQVERVDEQGPLMAMQSAGEVEIEALVTAVSANSRFTMAGFQVDASRATFSPAGVHIDVGSRLEVRGSWQAGVLMATKVEIEDEQALQSVELMGMIESYKGVADFVVRGQRCDASGLINANVSHGLLADLKNGVKVKLKGSKAGNVVRVSELEIVMND